MKSLKRGPPSLEGLHPLLALRELAVRMLIAREADMTVPSQCS